MLWFLEVPTWSASVRTPHALLTLWVALRTFTITPASAQWTPLPALGQSTRAVAKEPTVLAIAKSARLLAVGYDQSKAVTFYHLDTATIFGITTCQAHGKDDWHYFCAALSKPPRASTRSVIK